MDCTKFLLPKKRKTDRHKYTREQSSDVMNLKNYDLTYIVAMVTTYVLDDQE